MPNPISFKKWLQNNSSGELLRHARRKKFPNRSGYRDVKCYLNSKYRSKYLSDSIILEIETQFELYQLNSFCCEI